MCYTARTWVTYYTSSIFINKAHLHYNYTIFLQQKIFFRRSFFLYNPCPILEGMKDVLFYKFKRPTIGQICSAMCTSKDGHRDAFSNERCRKRRTGILRGLLSRPPSLEWSERRGLFFATAWWHGGFDWVRTSPLQSLASSSSCYWPASRGVVYEVILKGLKFVLLQLACALY